MSASQRGVRSTPLLPTKLADLFSFYHDVADVSTAHTQINVQRCTLIWAGDVRREWANFY